MRRATILDPARRDLEKVQSRYENTRAADGVCNIASYYIPNLDRSIGSASGEESAGLVDGQDHYRGGMGFEGTDEVEGECVVVGKLQGIDPQGQGPRAYDEVRRGGSYYTHALG